VRVPVWFNPVHVTGGNAMAGLKQFFERDSAGGVVLVVAALAALAIANSPLSPIYDSIFDLKVVVAVGELSVDKPLLLWINDGLMAVFFFLIGLEIKREILVGELKSIRQALLPLIAAGGGFVLPAVIYAGINADDPLALRGWAIPTATDIAFALGVLALFGSRVPIGLKVFLTSLAIFDDIAAIIVIALFYTVDLSTLALILASAGYFCLFLLNRLGITRIAPYVLVGVFIWTCVLKSGVHATIAGFVVALAIPMRSQVTDYAGSPLRYLEVALHPWVAFFILPIFAFANAGVSFAGLTLADLVDGVSLGIVLGLFVGKQVGVMLAVALTVLLGLARLPTGAAWATMYGVALITGIGFTMSLFVGTLAFEAAPAGLDAQVRGAVLLGSLASATLGYVVLRTTLPRGR
jgi:NhaA family Na+:H+ antiporter